MIEMLKNIFGMTDALPQELVQFIYIYLRKSRTDNQFNKEEAIEKTLERHKNSLQEFALRTFGCKIPEENILYEVVSGDTISDRPEMKKLLSLIESDDVKGVLCIEVERLGRGDSIDQGIIVQRFQLTKTCIITPNRLYNLDDEFDLEYFERSLQLAREFLKYIKKVLTRGREDASREGKDVTSRSKYGTKKEKLINEKGYKNINDENSHIVRKIFEDYMYEDIMPPTIANQLNALGIPSPAGKLWTAQAVRNILKKYKEYSGYTIWNKRKTVKKIVDGEVVKTRPLNKDYICVKSRGDSIITEEEAELVKEKLEKNSIKLKKDFKLKNPLAGIIKCSRCNHNLTMHKSHKSTHEYVLICRTPNCKMVSSYLDLVEQEILQSLQNILLSYEKSLNDFKNGKEEKIKNLEKEKKKLLKRIEDIKIQKVKAFDLLNDIKEIVGEETFKMRIEYLNNQITIVNDRLIDIDKKMAQIKNEEAILAIPVIKNCLNLYNNATIEEKNQLLSSIIDTVYYTKEAGGRWENKANKFTLEIKLKINPKK